MRPDPEFERNDQKLRVHAYVRLTWIYLQINQIETLYMIQGSNVVCVCAYLDISPQKLLKL